MQQKGEGYKDLLGASILGVLRQVLTIVQIGNRRKYEPMMRAEESGEHEKPAFLDT